MFCLYCGAQLPEEAVFCNRCGRKLELPSHHASAALTPLPLSVVSMPISAGAEQQDELSASPSVSQQSQVDPTQDGAPSSSPSESSLHPIYRTGELSLLPFTSGTASSGILTLPGQQPPQAPGQKKRRRIWMVLSSIVVVLLLLAAWGGFIYANRSTPSKTLATVCQALKSNDFPTVYDQFSKALRSRLGPEPMWASGRQQDYNRQGGLTDCTVSSVNESGSSVAGIVTLTFAHEKVEEDRVRLLNENGQWVIQETAIKTAIGGISEFALPTAKSDPVGMTVGPDGNLWFTEYLGGKIGRISSSGSLSEFTGSISEFALPTANSSPVDIVLGPDGNLWFTESSSNKIGRISSSGSISEFALPTASGPTWITAGPDGNLWFTESSSNKIGRITTSGNISEFALPTAKSGLGGITVGPDGNLWFTEYDGNKIGRISRSGSISEFALPTANSGPEAIRAGSDGNLWFTEYDGNKIGRISSSGSISEFALPTANSGPASIAVGLDGNLWFTESSGNKIGRISSSGNISEFALPTANSEPAAITAGSDGNLWFTEVLGNKIGRISSK